MKTYFVYILKCADESYYTGVKNCLKRRFAEQISGINVTCYTYDRRPFELVFSCEFKYIDKAIAFEKQVKGWSRKKKEAVINGQWNELKPLAKCRNETHWKNYDAGKE